MSSRPTSALPRDCDTMLDFKINRVVPFCESHKRWCTFVLLKRRVSSHTSHVLPMASALPRASAAPLCKCQKTMAVALVYASARLSVPLHVRGRSIKPSRVHASCGARLQDEVPLFLCQRLDPVWSECCRYAWDAIAEWQARQNEPLRTLLGAEPSAQPRTARDGTGRGKSDLRPVRLQADTWTQLSRRCQLCRLFGSIYQLAGEAGRTPGSVCH